MVVVGVVTGAEGVGVVGTVVDVVTGGVIDVVTGGVVTEASISEGSGCDCDGCEVVVCADANAGTVRSAAAVSADARRLSILMFFILPAPQKQRNK